MTTSPRTDGERARAFDRAIFAGGADTVGEHPWGVELRTPSLPLVRNLNAVYTREPRDTDLLAIYVDGDGAAAPGPGWDREVGVFMAHRGTPPEPDPRPREVALEAVAPLRREWLRDEIPDAERRREEIIDQILLADARLFSRTPTRVLTIGGDAMTLLVGDGPVRMVEDVYTTPSARGRGLASALVRTALATAYGEGAELVFLPTHEGGPAQPLYERLGFAVVAHTSMFFRSV